MRITNIAAATISTRYFHTDHLGSIAVIIDENANVIERLSYDAWGKRRFPNGSDDPSNSITSQTTRGFTGEEQLQTASLVHLNGRVYDSLLARFTSADPTVTDPTNPQGWNRYSYVGNDPLAFTDPNGFSWLSGFFHSVSHFFSGIVHSITHFLQTNTIARSILQLGLNIILSPLGPIGAAIAAVVVTGLSGGSLSQILKAGLIAGVTAFAFQQIGDWTGHTPAFGTEQYAENVAGHALVGCGSAVASGGKCGAGALSGAVGSAFAPAISGPDGLFPDAQTDLGQRFGGTIFAATVGGFASVAGGGKFANGAVTGAFGYLYNYLACDHGACYGSGITKEEIDSHYRDNTGWPVYAGSINVGWLDSSQFDAIPVGSQGLIHTNWPAEIALDALNPFRDVGDRNIYGDFTATRVDNDHFLWNDTYNFDIKPGYSPSVIARDAATYWGGIVAGQGQGGKSFDIIGIKPALIPGR